MCWPEVSGDSIGKYRRQVCVYILFDNITVSVSHFSNILYCHSADRTRRTCTICKSAKSSEAVHSNIIRHYLSEKHRQNVCDLSRAGDAVQAGVGVHRDKRLYRENIPQSIIDDAIVIACRKSLPFTAVPLMLNHTARALNAVAGNDQSKINIVDIRKVSSPAANILLRLQAVTEQQNTRGGSRMIVRRCRTYITNRLTALAKRSSALKVKFLKRCQFLCVSCDETDAWSLTSPLAVALQGCDAEFNWGNFFIGQTDVSLTKDGKGIFKATKDVIDTADLDANDYTDMPDLIDTSIPDSDDADGDKGAPSLWDRIVWSTTDGASAMRSTPKYAGLDAKIDGSSFVAQMKISGKKDIGNTHCICHNWNLALKETIAEHDWCGLWIQHIRAVYNWFSKSPARKSKFAMLSEEMQLLGRVVTWKLVYPKYYCPTRWVGIVTALTSICNAIELHQEYCRCLIEQGFAPDRETTDVEPEEVVHARVDDVDAEDPVRYHSETFYVWDDADPQPWDLAIPSIAGDDEILDIDDRVDLDCGELSNQFQQMASATSKSKKSKLLNERIGMTDLNLGLDSMMLDVLQPYKRLVERLQVQNGPIGHRLCGWIIEFFDSINTMFLEDTATFGHHFNAWMGRHDSPEYQGLIEQLKLMGHAFLHTFLKRVRYRIQPYWKFIMGLELVNPCAPHRISVSAWEGLKDLMKRAGFNRSQRIEAINGLKLQRRQAARWMMPQINHCNRNVLAWYKEAQSANPLENAVVYDVAQLVFSLHAASAIIETFFSKTAYIKSKCRKSMNDSTVAKVLHVSQTPQPEDIETLLPDPISIDVTAASKRTENDLDTLKAKYVGRKVTRSFPVDGESVSYKGVIDKVYWEMELHKFLFHVVYTGDDDQEELELWQVRLCVN